MAGPTTTASTIAVATPTNTPPTTPTRILDVPNVDTLQVEMHTRRTLHERQAKTLAIARTNHALVAVSSRKTHKRKRDTSAEAEEESETEQDPASTPIVVQGRDNMHTRRTPQESQAKPQGMARTNHAFVAVPMRRTYERKLNASAETEGESETERDPTPSPPVVVRKRGRPRKASKFCFIHCFLVPTLLLMAEALVLPSARVRDKKRLREFFLIVFSIDLQC